MKYNYSEQQFLQLARERIYDLVRNIPFISDIEVIDVLPGPAARTCGDLEATIHFEGDRLPIILWFEIRSRGERKFVEQFIQIRQRCEKPEQLVFVAPYISTESAAFLREKRCSYMDLSGNCFISAEPLFISVQGKSNQFLRQTHDRDYLDRRASAASTLLRTALQSPEKNWKLQELADAAHKSIGMASNIRKFLLRHGWAEEGDQGFHLCNIDELLRAWAKEYHRKDDRIIRCYSLDNIPEIERGISLWNKRSGGKAVLGRFGAAARYAPTVRYRQAFVYVESQDVQDFLRSMDLREVDSGENVVIVIPHDETPCLYAREMDDIWVTSPEQTVLDLLSGVGRGEEAAAAVIEKRLKG